MPVRRRAPRSEARTDRLRAVAVRCWLQASRHYEAQGVWARGVVGLALLCPLLKKIKEVHVSPSNIPIAIWGGQQKAGI